MGLELEPPRPINEELNSLELIFRWERSDVSRPRALTLSELEFSLPHPEHSSWELLRFADYLGLDEATGGGVYKLSLEKCATLRDDEIRRISRYGILLSEEVLREIYRLRGEKILNIDLWGGDLVLSATRGLRASSGAMQNMSLRPRPTGLSLEASGAS